jgi:hypothetical protein
MGIFEFSAIEMIIAPRERLINGKPICGSNRVRGFLGAVP